ncbi:NPP1 family protein [Candidatus Bathyarchaeota archaeon]|nr:NPP1 family protein [Candidatus Bathyarchaeota archaeon]
MPSPRYDYYFEKDQASHGTFASGHPHDWENIVVFTAGEGADEHVIFTAASCHHGYGGGDALLGGGTHPLVVYNKDGTQTHCFRLASPDDVAQAENHTGGFVNTPLLGWGRLRDEVPKAYEAIANSDNWGGTSAKIQDSEFAVWLNKAREAGGDLLFDFNASIG